MGRFVLASASPRRRRLLEAAGLEFETIPAEIDEEAVGSGSPRGLVMKLAVMKANAVAARLAGDTVVIASDTVVALGTEILNKPVDREDAVAMLGRLSGVEHTVYTGLAVARAGGELLVDAAAARVRFHELSEAQIREFVASGEADDKAGSYGVQQGGVDFVADVRGDLSCVIGLPLELLSRMYAQLTGESLFNGHSLRRLLRATYADLEKLPAACFDGVPD
jgi:septum formation protein